jgi:hypothetical protein
VLLALHCRVRLLSRVWVVACRWDSEPCVSLSRTRTRDERWPEQIEATFFFVEKRDCFDLIDAAGKSRLCFAGRWAAAKETIAPAPLPAGHRRAVEKREASRKFRFGESKASQAADTPLSLSLSLSLMYSKTVQFLSLPSLSLLVSRHTVLPPSLPTKRQPTREGAAERRERKSKPRRECAPLIPFCSNRRRRLARDPLRVPRRSACPLARGERRSPHPPADRRRSSAFPILPRCLAACGFPPRASCM